MSSETPLLRAGARVRPRSQPVPPAFAGTVAGKVFASLARMNDGARHDTLRAVVEARIAALRPEFLERAAAECAALLHDGAGFVERFPIYVLARALGVPSAELDRLFPAARDFANAMAQDADAEALARGIPAAELLVAIFERVGAPRPFEEVANDVGFMFQGYAGMRALLRSALAAPAGVLAEIVYEDPPIAATRRFFGDDVVVVSLREHPFGAGSHACPGREIALAIVALGLRYFANGVASAQ